LFERQALLAAIPLLYVRAIFSIRKSF